MTWRDVPLCEVLDAREEADRARDLVGSSSREMQLLHAAAEKAHAATLEQARRHMPLHIGQACRERHTVAHCPVRPPKVTRGYPRLLVVTCGYSRL